MGLFSKLKKAVSHTLGAKILSTGLKHDPISKALMKNDPAGRAIMGRLTGGRTDELFRKGAVGRPSPTINPHNNPAAVPMGQTAPAPSIDPTTGLSMPAAPSAAPSSPDSAAGAAGTTPGTPAILGPFNPGNSGMNPVALPGAMPQSPGPMGSVTGPVAAPNVHPATGLSMGGPAPAPNGAPAGGMAPQQLGGFLRRRNMMPSYKMAQMGMNQQ